MAYQPFLIAPFGTGLDSDLEPWLLPQDAFKEIENGHIHHGYLEKRQGYRFLGDMVHGDPITAATAASPAVFTIASTAALTTGDTISLHYLAGGTWSTLNAQKYTVTVASGTTFTLTDSSGTAVDGTGLGTYTASTGYLGTFTADRIMGIFRYIGSDNTRELLISDDKRIAIYNTASNLFQPLSLYDISPAIANADVWASTDEDYIWAANWQHAGSVNRVYITNGKAYVTGTPGTDGIVYYDATDRGTPTTPCVVQFQPALNATDDLYGCKLMFSIKQRLLCLHTFEFNGANTSTFPQRARWCAAQDPSNWDDTVPGGGGFVDAPTGEQIISARQVQDIIIVYFTDSVWTLRPVPDPALPFRWDKINDFRACDAKMGSTGYDRYVVAVGQRGITATDGVETRRVDERIEDFVDDDVNTTEFGKVFAQRSFADRRTWFLYPKDESDEANAALIYDDESSAYSKYIFANTTVMNALGYGSVSKDYAAQDFIAANDLDKAAEDFNDETALSFFWSAKAELFLGGDRAGAIYILETEGTDDGTAIDFSVMSAGWNPYKDQGVECQFGYIDFYCDSDEKTKLNVQFYKNDNETPYASQAMDLLPDLKYKANVSNIVPNADPTTGFVVTSNTHGVTAGDNFYIYGVESALFYNDAQFLADSVTNNTITVAQDITGFGSVITGISQANPGVVTAVAHGLSNGQVITIVNVSGMTEVNGLTFTVANATDDDFELSGVDTSGFTAYTSGGYAFKKYASGGQISELRFYRTKVWKRVLAGGVGYLHSIKITSEGSNRPLKIHAFKPWFRARGKRTLG